MQGEWRPKWLRVTPYEERAGTNMFGLALNFGITLGISVFLMYQLGMWLDAKFGIGMIGIMALVIFGIVSSLNSLIRRILEEEARAKECKKP